MKIKKKEQLRQKIDSVEKKLKDIERTRWSSAESEKIKERGEEFADFFRIIYNCRCSIKCGSFWKNTDI